jgi:hypothetical protein
LSVDNQGIQEYINSLEKETKAIKKEILKLCWYMRGGLTYDQGMMLSLEDRELISDIIKDNLETTKKTKMPFF